MSERALRRAEELAEDADVCETPPKDDQRQETTFMQQVPQAVTPGSNRLATTDPRLPPRGTQLTRHYKGRQFVVSVQPDGIEYAGERCWSLSHPERLFEALLPNGCRKKTCFIYNGVSTLLNA